MTRRRKFILITTAILIVGISNFYSSYINLVISGLFQQYDFKTENKAFEFSAIPSKGRDIYMMERNFESFLQRNPQTEDTVLYRTFKRNPLKFWNWYQYSRHEMYTKYEYKK